MLSLFSSETLRPWLMNIVSDSDAMALARAETLENVRGNILEIGIGRGLSLRHYPRDVAQISALEQSPKRLKKACQLAAKSKVSVIPHLGDAASMPFADETFDYAVSHLSLCSIKNASAALLEVKRILKTNGRFIFLEHGACSDPAIRKWQDRWNSVQNLFGGACNCNRPIDTMIAQSGLKIEDLKTYHMGDAPRVLDHMYQGTARKTYP